MAYETYAAPTDVLARWGKDPSEVEDALTTLIATRLGDVERMIKRRFKKLDLNLDAQVDAEEIDVEDLKQVEAEAVLRLARNPDGFFSETDGNYTYQLMQDLASGTLELLPEEWEILGIVETGLFVLDPTPVLST